MTTIYHLTEDGPKPCRALKRACPLGGKHFENFEEAQLGYEDSMGLEYGFSDTPLKVNFSELYNQPLFQEGRYLSESKEFFSKLTEDETEALKGYTSVRYGDLNSALYGGRSRKKSIQVEIKALDAALSKSREAPKNLWRSLSGRDLPQNFNAENHQVGEVIHFSGFTSTSETPDALMHIPSDTVFYMAEVPFEDQKTDPTNEYKVLPSKEYTDGRALNAIFKINAKRAAPVSTLRSVLAEQEWLLPRDLNFRITAIYRNVEIGELEGIRSQGTRAQVYEIEEI